MRDLKTEEWDVLKKLRDAWNLFIKLPPLHQDDGREFCAAIHAAQLIVMGRPVIEQEADMRKEREKSGFGKPGAGGTHGAADANRVQQVLFNLVDNAITYGRSEGHVWIGAQAAEDQRIEVSVRDNGPGIPPDAIERVFERFYRVDKARSREQGGTGLGLSIVKHIVQSHGGEVWAKSAVGQGTTFLFTLPSA